MSKTDSYLTQHERKQGGESSRVGERVTGWGERVARWEGGALELGKECTPDFSPQKKRKG